ncbi:tripartite motif containing 62 S homeolog [Xenopus laevis]|uniref:Trim62 protein n=1 Tax=Xenopus laevis TaxID=8355 RepID=Q505M2_XENLA|nr:tripartite motif containing 62 S homeolog [Xenopus laevis]AAH94484.1 Trim62 protein [Xenopus laevis]
MASPSGATALSEQSNPTAPQTVTEETGESSGGNDELIEIGCVYPCKKGSGTLRDARIMNIRTNKKNDHLEYYVHYVGLNQRQDEWVDRSRLLLPEPLTAKEEENGAESQNRRNQESSSITETLDSETPLSPKRKLEGPEPEPKKIKVERQESVKNELPLAPDEDLAEELTCSLCHELFKEPVLVECGHNFCKSCIENAWEARGSASCPECEEPFAERSFIINRTLEKLVKKSLSCGGFHTEKKELVGMCSDHNEKIKLYCQEDGLLGCVICHDSLQHNYHSFLPLMEAVDVYKEELSAMFQSLNSSLKASEEITSQQREIIVEHKEKMAEYKQHITSQFEKMHKFLEERETVLLDQLQKQGDNLLKEMESNVIKLENDLKDIKKAIDRAKERLDETNTLCFLKDIKTFIDECQKQKTAVESTENTVVSKELCRATFKGPIQYFVWSRMKHFLVPKLEQVTADPNTAHPNLLLSYGLTTIKYKEKRSHVFESVSRFNQNTFVLGKNAFNSGQHYWLVNVRNKTDWDVGMTRDSSNRKGTLSLIPANGYWILQLRNRNEYTAIESPAVRLNLTCKPQRIGVYLDYEGGMISFYDADEMTHIYTFREVFTGKLHPCLSPHVTFNSRNSEPLQLEHY